MTNQTLKNLAYTRSCLLSNVEMHIEMSNPVKAQAAIKKVREFDKKYPDVRAYWQENYNS